MAKSFAGKAFAKKHWQRPLIVHIGNIGTSAHEEEPVAETRQYAKRFPAFRFLGIDISKWPAGVSKPKNVFQAQGHFVKGLSRLKDNSASIISSKMTICHHAGQNKEIRAAAIDALNLAYKKLKPKGKLVLVFAPWSEIGLPQELFAQTPFKESKIKIKHLTKEQRAGMEQLSFWTRNFAGWDVLLVVAEK